MKLLLFIVFLILISTTIYSDECSRTINPDDVPCQVISTFLPSGGCNVNGTVFTDNGTIRQSFTWNESLPFCQFSWNISSPASTYVYNSSIETGVITVEVEDNMLSIVLSFMFIIAFYVFIGVSHSRNGFARFFCWGLALIEFMILVWIIWINEIGGDFTGLLQVNAISTLIIGGTLGFWSIFVIYRRFASMKDEVIEDDNFTKWGQK